MNALTIIPYAEFGISSNFSFLRGASKPEELVVTAKFHGFSSIGLADRNTVAGVVRAWQQARVEKMAYHPGCRLVFRLERELRHAAKVGHHLEAGDAAPLVIVAHLHGECLRDGLARRCRYLLQHQPPRLGLDGRR